MNAHTTLWTFSLVRILFIRSFRQTQGRSVFSLAVFGNSHAWFKLDRRVEQSFIET